jgi:hypothetical protein
MIMCVRNNSCLIFLVEKQGDVCELDILFFLNYWISRFELLIICHTFEYFLNEVLSEILMKRENL